MLDLPEPWQVVPHLASVMHAGGVMVAYTPSITQAVKVREALVANRGEWVAMRTLEDLRAGGRLVGIISHVPELKERVAARLEVRPGLRGSTARFVA